MSYGVLVPRLFCPPWERGWSWSSPLQYLLYRGRPMSLFAPFSSWEFLPEIFCERNTPTLWISNTLPAIFVLPILSESTLTYSNVFVQTPSTLAVIFVLPILIESTPTFLNVLRVDTEEISRDTSTNNRLSETFSVDTEDMPRHHRPRPTDPTYGKAGFHPGYGAAREQHVPDRPHPSSGRTVTVKAVGRSDLQGTRARAGGDDLY